MNAAVMPPDWYGACRRIAAELRSVLAELATTSARSVELGRGAGGDITLRIDAEAERVIFAELDRLHGEGHRFSVVSEERGEVDYGGGPLRVVVDPIDGSLNAKRGLAPYAVSIAVADGATMADVEFGYVYDFALDEEWSATRGSGALLNGTALDGRASVEHRTADGLLEIVAIDSSRPEWLLAGLQEFVGVAHRVRAYGSIAYSLCQLAAGRVDAMATLSHARSVDAAAAQLILRESGGYVAFISAPEPLGMLLDLGSRSAIVAARSAETLERLAAKAAMRS
jgi:myo-inositol-1(or 4)-monophosphatase